MNEPHTSLHKLSDELKHLKNKLAVMESTLIQRQEEIEQTRAEAEKLRLEIGRLFKERNESESRRKDADSWVFKLAAERKRLETEVEGLTMKLAKLEEAMRAEVKLLTSKLERSEAERDNVAGVAAHARAQVATLERDLSKAQVATAELRRSGEVQLSAALDKLRDVQSEADQKLAERSGEIAQLTSMLAEQNALNAQKELDNAWLRDMMTTTGRMPKWWMLLPESSQRKRRHAFYRKAGLFDASVYLNAYPDVAQDGMDPVRHYILHGMAEGRQCPLP